MILYRAMCEDEFLSTKSTFDFQKRFKWFGTEEFVMSRVRDGRFNNSHNKTKKDAYTRLIKVYFDDSTFHHLVNCGNNEWMLDVRKVSLVKYQILERI